MEERNYSKYKLVNLLPLGITLLINSLLYCHTKRHCVFLLIFFFQRLANQRCNAYLCTIATGLLHFQVQFLREKYKNLDIEVDGGVGPKTIQQCADVCLSNFPSDCLLLCVCVLLAVVYQRYKKKKVVGGVGSETISVQMFVCRSV